MSRCSVLAVVSLCCGVLSGVWVILVFYLTAIPFPRSVTGPTSLGAAAALGMMGFVSSILALVLGRNQPPNRHTTAIAITGMVIAAGSLGLILSLLLLVAVFANG